MNAIIFDKLAYVEALQSSGISKKEAAAHAAALDTAMREGVATSADLVEVRHEIADVKNELKADIADLKSELKADIVEVRHEIADVKSELKIELRALELRLMTRLGGMFLAGIAVVAALVKYL